MNQNLLGAQQGTTATRITLLSTDGRPELVAELLGQNDQSYQPITVLLPTHGFTLLQPFVACHILVNAGRSIPTQHPHSFYQFGRSLDQSRLLDSYWVPTNSARSLGKRRPPSVIAG